LIATIASLFFQFRNSPGDETAINPDTIAVMPFSVRGSQDLEYLGEGIVDLLSVKLDGAGELRTIDPNALFGTITKDGLTIVTPDDAVALANRLGAGRAIVGNVTQIGDVIQITASLYQSDAEPEIEVSVEATSDAGVPSAIDDLARQIIEGLLVDPDWKYISLAGMTTKSLQALKAYLNGAQQIRRGSWQDAGESFQEAVEIDSTFALAWSSLAYAYGWQADTLEFAALEHALRHSESLPWRARTLVEAANHGFNLGNGEKAKDLYLSILADYPNDTQALRGMGETLFHYNPLLGRPQSDANEYFERAATLAPDNADYLLHLMDAALDEWDFVANDSLAAIAIAIADREDSKEWEEHMSAITRRSHGDSSWTISGTGSMNTLLVRHLWLKAATHVEDLDAAEQIANMMTEPGRYPKEDREWMLFETALTVAGQGRLKEGSSIASGAGPHGGGLRIVVQSILFGLPAYPVSEGILQTTLDELEAWDPTEYPVVSYHDTNVHAGEYDIVKAYLTGLLANRLHDRLALEEQKEFLADRADSTSRQDLAFSALRSLEALEAFQAGDFEVAIEAVDEARLHIHWREAGKSPLFEQVVDRFIKAEALRQNGQLEEAITIYRSITAGDHTWGLIFIGPSYLGVADAYEQLGETEKAIEFYARLVRMWENCDPELVPVRDAAEAELERLLAKSVMEPEA